MKCFGTNQNLTRHMRVHTREKPYQCQICQKKFSKAQPKNKHEKLCKGPSIDSNKDWSWNSNNNVLTSNSSKSHSYTIKTRSNSRCNIHGNGDVNVNSEQDSDSGSDGNSNSDSDEQAVNDIDQNDDDGYECQRDGCTARFKSQGGLYGHEQRIHLKKFQCKMTQCVGKEKEKEKCFSSYADLVRHKKQIHKKKGVIRYCKKCDKHFLFNNKTESTQHQCCS